MLLRLLFVLALQWLPISAQVLFNQPTGGQVINGGVPFIVSVTDSFTAPFFSQMTNFSLLLFAGTYSSPVRSHHLLRRLRTKSCLGHALCLESFQHFSLHCIEQYHLPSLHWALCNLNLLPRYQRLHSRQHFYLSHLFLPTFHSPEYDRRYLSHSLGSSHNTNLLALGHRRNKHPRNSDKQSWPYGHVRSYHFQQQRARSRRNGRVCRSIKFWL